MGLTIRVEGDNTQGLVAISESNRGPLVSVVLDANACLLRGERGERGAGGQEKKER